MCLWCHQNCHHVRTLLSHFQLKQDHLHLSLHGIRFTQLDSHTSELPFSAHLDVTFESSAAPHLKPKLSVGKTRAKSPSSRSMNLNLAKFQVVWDPFPEQNFLGMKMLNCILTRCGSSLKLDVRDWQERCFKNIFSGGLRRHFYRPRWSEPRLNAQRLKWAPTKSELRLQVNHDSNEPRIQVSRD